MYVDGNKLISMYEFTYMTFSKWQNYGGEEKMSGLLYWEVRSVVNMKEKHNRDLDHCGDGIGLHHDYGDSRWMNLCIW
jgi:hypothetical protein